MRDLIKNLSDYLAARAEYFAARAQTHRDRVDLTAWSHGYREGREVEREFWKEAQKHDKG